MFELYFKKAEEPEIKLPICLESSKKQECSRKTSTSVSLTTSKPLTLWITTNCEKFFKRWEYRRREQTELDSVLGQAVNIRLHTWPPSQWTLNFVPSVYRNGMPMENQTPGQKSLRTWTWTLCCLKEYASCFCNRTKGYIPLCLRPQAY